MRNYLNTNINQWTLLLGCYALALLLACGSSKNSDTSQTQKVDESRQAKGGSPSIGADYQLPAWADANRVQAHMIFLGKFFNRKDFVDIAPRIKELGATTYTRHFKTGGEGAYWKSAVGTRNNKIKGTNRNPVKEMIEDAHSNGMRIIGYYWHVGDKWAERKHPDWMVRDYKGELVKVARGNMLCLNSPYFDYYQTRAKEIAEMGADGLYHDYMHVPQEGCWCEHCQNDFSQTTGLKVPRDPDDKLWKNYKAFTNEVAVKQFTKLRASLHRINPNFVMIVGSNTWTSLTDYHLSESLWRNVDMMKIEHRLSNKLIEKGRGLLASDRMEILLEDGLEMAKGLILARDATDGRPPHVWCSNFANQINAEFATASILTHGGIANLTLNDPASGNEHLEGCFELGRKVSSTMMQTKPLKYIGIHYPEKYRNQHLDNKQKIWREVLRPLNFVFEACMNKDIPVGFITDSQIADNSFADFEKIIFLSKDMVANKRQIDQLRKQGKQIIELDSKLIDQINNDKTEALRQFFQQYPELLYDSPVRLISAAEGSQIGCFQKKNSSNLVINCVNDFSWTKTYSSKKLKLLKSSKRPTKALAVPEVSRATNNQLELKIKNGKVPKRISEVFSGKKLSFTRVDKGKIKINLPEYNQMISVLVQY